MRILERLAIVVAALALAITIIALLSGGLLAGRDNPGISGAGAMLGVAYKDLGHAHLRPGQPHPRYDSSPPTSGAHVPDPVLRDEAPLSNDQLLQALETGDVVFLYAGPHPPPGLRALAARLAGPFTPALAASGQAVVLAPRAGTHGIVAAAWTRLLTVGSASDPRLAAFARAALGQGAAN
ncbi:MAG TPA: DUF3105 domain-containing protein [Solirubrobacteraceae bacterium]|nr:DUF3105 domain-containing protein [Solirubrobacteraceae bacterium]